ncbi:MAG: GAF domain-containing protein, partial [Dehalococcoidia bacterium]
RLAALYAMSQTLSSTIKMDTVLQSGSRETVDIMQADVGIILLSDVSTGKLVLRAKQTASDEFLEVETAWGETLCAKACQSGEPVQVDDVSQDAGFTGSAATEATLKAWLCRPLTARGVTLGAIGVGKIKSHGFSSEDMELLTTVSNHFGLAIQNATLYEEVQHKEELRGQLLHKAITAQEEERKRLARELHDGLAQNLNTVILTLQALEEALPPSQTALTQMLSRCKQLGTASVGEIRDMITALRPSMLDELGLVSAIRWYAEKHMESQGINVHLKASALRGRWSAEIETALFRTIQEAINNIAKHAQARTAWISLTSQDSKLVVTVADDGRGFSTDQVLGIEQGTHALGLLGMQERVSLLGGHLDIWSKPGEGTRIKFEVPVHS